MDDLLLMPVDGWEIAKQGEMKRATEIVRRIEENKIDITNNCGEGWEVLAWHLSYFGEGGRELFERVSSIAVDFDSNITNELFTEKLDAKSKPKSPGGFFKIAKKCGVDTSIKVKKEGAKGSHENEEREKEKFLPDGADIEDWRKFGLWEQDGQYWSLTEKMIERPITNFVMKILFHLRISKDEAYKIIHIKNDHGYEYTIHMNTDDFVSTGVFKKCLLRYGRFLFFGNETDLLKLHDKLLREDRDAKPIKALGYDKKSGLWFFANGLCDCTRDGEFIPIDEFGIIEYKQAHYFIPALSKIFADEEEDFENDKKFIYQNGGISFDKWATLFCQVYGQRGWMAIVFWWASIHRDVIKSVRSRFPMLNLYGQKSTGKGALAESLMKLFGLGQNQLMLGGPSTTKGMMRKLANLSNSIVWFDEYKNNLDKKIIESLKNIYDGIGYEKAATDNSTRTKSTPVNSSVLLSGQEMPTIEPALFTRVILLQFEPLNMTEESRDRYGRLKSLESAGISALTIEAISFREQVAEAIANYYDQEFKLLNGRFGEMNIVERLRENYALMMAAARILAESMKLPFTIDQFRTYCFELIQHQHFILAGNDDVSKFWEIVENLFNKGILMEGQDYELEDGKLFIRIQNVYGEYAKELRQRNDPNILAKPTLENYLESDATRFLKKRKKQFSNGSYTHCMVFDYPKLDINLIRAASKEEVEMKMRSMGVPVPEPEVKPITQQSSLYAAMEEANQMDY